MGIDSTADSGHPTDFQLLLQFNCFVRFLSADLRIKGSKQAEVALTISNIDSRRDCDAVLDSERTRHMLHEIESALRTYGTDPSWKDDGLDGVDIRGSFRSAASHAQEFAFWSPRPGTPAHRLVSAALDYLPVDHAHPAFEALEELRAAVGTLSRR